MPTPPSAVRRCGISLMEVLVAIGILSIGLLSMLALLPAGRTYLVKADVEDQAAALVPNAIATVESWGLFREDALEWRTIRQDPESDGEPVALRPQWDLPNEARWDRAAPEAARIEAWHGTVPDPLPTSLRISGRAGAEQNTVNIEIRRNGRPHETKTLLSEEDGTWSFEMSLVPPPSREEIIESGDDVGELDEDVESAHEYTLTAWYMKEQPPPEPPVKTDCEALNPQSKKLEGPKRKQVLFSGPATIELTVDNEEGSNDTPESAQAIDMNSLTDDVMLGKIRMVRRIWLDYRGTLWKFNKGVRGGTYSETRTYGPGARDPVTTLPGWAQERQDPGAMWKTGPTAVEDRDFFSLPTRKGYFVGIDWGDSPNASPWGISLLPAAFNGQPLSPYENDATSVRFSMPNNGRFVAGVGIGGPANSVTRTVAGLPQNPAYDLEISVFRGDRMIAIDPLMCTHLDKALFGKISALPKLADRRRYFADYERLYQGRTTDDRASIVPRLNWKVIADIDIQNDPDAAIAVADQLCRAVDSPATIEPQSPDEPPAPEFDAAGMRQMAGRMTWMLTVQPDGPGSVEANWMAGKSFEAAVVIFQDRIFPTGNVAAADDLEGEYAFRSGWRMDDGRLHVEVPDVDEFGRRAPVDEDLRQLFAPGAWLLLGPAVNVVSADIEARKSYEWVKILSAEYDRPGGVTTLPAGPSAANNGPMTIVKVLLDREPAENVLLPGASRDQVQGGLSLSTFAYQGVVAVVKRSIQVKPQVNP